MRYLFLLSLLLTVSCSEDPSSKTNNGQNQNNVNNLNNNKGSNNLTCDTGPCLFNAIKIEGFSGRVFQSQNKLRAISIGSGGVFLSTFEGQSWVPEQIAETSGFVESYSTAVNPAGDIAVAWLDSQSLIRVVTKVDEEWVVEELLELQDLSANFIKLAYTDEIVLAFAGGQGQGILTKENGTWEMNKVPDSTPANASMDFLVFQNKFYLASHDYFEEKRFHLAIWDGQTWSKSDLLTEVSAREASRNISLVVESDKVFASLGAVEGFKIGEITDGTWIDSAFPQLEDTVGNHRLLFEDGKPLVAYIGKQPSYSILKDEGWATQQIYSTDSDNGSIDAMIDPISKKLFILLNARDGLRSMTPIGAYPADHFDNCDVLTTQACSKILGCGSSDSDGDICVFPNTAGSSCFSEFGCPGNVRSSFCGDASTTAESIVSCIESLDSGMCGQQPDGDLGFFLSPECGSIYQ